MTTTNAQIEAELNALPDSAFLDGQGLAVGEGDTFRLGNRILTCVGYQNRKIWDDASDQWVTRWAAGCRLATQQEAIEAGYAEEAKAIAEVVAPAAKPVPTKRYAIRADSGKGYFAIAGKSQGDAATKRIDKATIFDSISEAKAALAGIAEAAPGYFGEKQEPVVVVIL